MEFRIRGLGLRLRAGVQVEHLNYGESRKRISKIGFDRVCSELYLLHVNRERRNGSSPTFHQLVLSAKPAWRLRQTFGRHDFMLVKP